MPRFRATMTIVYEYDVNPDLYPTDDTEEMRALDGKVMAAEPEESIFAAVADGRAYMEVEVEDITPDEEGGK